MFTIVFSMEMISAVFLIYYHGDGMQAVDIAIDIRISVFVCFLSSFVGAICRNCCILYHVSCQKMFEWLLKED